MSHLHGKPKYLIWCFPLCDFVPCNAFLPLDFVVVRFSAWKLDATDWHTCYTVCAQIHPHPRLFFLALNMGLGLKIPFVVAMPPSMAVFNLLRSPFMAVMDCEVERCGYQTQVESTLAFRVIVTL